MVMLGNFTYSTHLKIEMRKYSPIILGSIFVLNSSGKPKYIDLDLKYPNRLLSFGFASKILYKHEEILRRAVFN